MKHVLLIAAVLLAAPAWLAVAQLHDFGTNTQQATEPVNSMCPIGKEPIVPSAGTVAYKGKVVGLCCPGCGKQFLAWEEARKDEFLALAAAGREPGTQRADQTKPADGTSVQNGAVAWTGLYPLDTCPISGQKLGSMGAPILKEYEGRGVRFCCAGCVKPFESDLVGSWKKVDEALVKDQLRYYPVVTCVVSGEPLVENGEDAAVNFAYGNRLVRLCCATCEGKFKADPSKFLGKLDKLVADAQRQDYPLDTCVVAGSKLGSMGEPTEIVVAGRLMRFCCANCEPKVRTDPAKFLGAIDKAWQAKGKFVPAVVPAVVPEGDDGEHGR